MAFIPHRSSCELCGQWGHLMFDCHLYVPPRSDLEAHYSRDGLDSPTLKRVSLLRGVSIPDLVRKTHQEAEAYSKKLRVFRAQLASIDRHSTALAGTKAERLRENKLMRRLYLHGINSCNSITPHVPASYSNTTYLPTVSTGNYPSATQGALTY